MFFVGLCFVGGGGLGFPEEEYGIQILEMLLEAGVDTKVEVDMAEMSLKTGPGSECSRLLNSTKWFVAQ
jgi:hypothetical protein